MDGLRKKMAEMKGVNSKENMTTDDSFNFNNKSTSSDENNRNLNLLTVLSSVKKEIDDIAEHDKVKSYQSVLL